jgi:hypothetical protein
MDELQSLLWNGPAIIPNATQQLISIASHGSRDPHVPLAVLQYVAVSSVVPNDPPIGVQLDHVLRHGVSSIIPICSPKVQKKF